MMVANLISCSETTEADIGGIRYYVTLVYCSFETINIEDVPRAIGKDKQIVKKKTKKKPTVKKPTVKKLEVKNPIQSLEL